MAGCQRSTSSSFTAALNYFAFFAECSLRYITGTCIITCRQSTTFEITVFIIRDIEYCKSVPLILKLDMYLHETELSMLSCISLPGMHSIQPVFSIFNESFCNTVIKTTNKCRDGFTTWNCSGSKCANDDRLVHITAVESIVTHDITTASLALTQLMHWNCLIKSGGGSYYYLFCSLKELKMYVSNFIKCGSQ